MIITYITIPSIASFPARMRLPSGGLDPRKLDMKTLMSLYSVREVSLVSRPPRRFTSQLADDSRPASDQHGGVTSLLAYYKTSYAIITCAIDPDI